MVIVAFYDNDKNARGDLLYSFLDAFPLVTSLYFVVNQKANDTILDQELELFKGKEYITEVMENLQFKLGPKSFYQTNSDQAYSLYKVARDFAGLSGNEIVYDLYTGTGTIANFVASKTLKTIGIEVVPEAIDDAIENSKRNDVQNTQFISGDIKDIFNIEFMEENGKPDVVIMDPPRAGVHKNVINALNAVLPQKIVYVSCNPATQARDISLLGNNYLVKKIQPVDMFPHTHHVENVVLLEKK
jgi:23S rRNA (uracil1939-C5)-methyltransferase